jgi:hypothetical protein
MREKRRPRVFDKRVLRGIFGTKRDEVKGEWRKLHNAELHDLYFSHSIFRMIKSRRVRWAGHVARMSERRDFWWGPEGKMQLRRPRCKWEDNIKVDLQEVGCGGMEWIELVEAKDSWRALVNAVMNVRGIF